MDDPRIGRIVYTASQIYNRTQAMAQEISEQLKQSDVATIDVVTVLNGAVSFSRDFRAAFRKYEGRVLIRNQEIKVTSSNGTKSSGSLRIEQDLRYHINGRNVLILEDIIDTGLTAQWLNQEMYRRGARDVVFVTMVDKPRGRNGNTFKPYLSGFVYQGDKWLIGKGLDVDGQFRELDHIREYEPIK